MFQVIFLIGPQCQGKSTFRKKLETFDDSEIVFVLSTDDVIENICKGKGITYNEGFIKYSDTAELYMNGYIDTVARICESGIIVVDRTNMSKKSRKKIADRIKYAMRKYGRKYVFSWYIPGNEIISLETFLQRNEERMSSYHIEKIITQKIFEETIAKYETPTVEEFQEMNR